MVLLNAVGIDKEERIDTVIGRRLAGKLARAYIFEKLTQSDGPNGVVGEGRLLVTLRISIVIYVVAVVLQQLVQSLSEVLGGHAADCRVVILIPHERLGS